MSTESMLANGKNPLIKRVQGAVSSLIHSRSKVNYGYIALGGTLGPGAFLAIWGAIFAKPDLVTIGVKLVERIGAPVVMAVIVSNVATKALNGNGGDRGTSGIDPTA